MPILGRESRLTTKRLRIDRLGLLVWLVALTGCLPVVSNYYNINGAGDKRTFAGCAMKVEAELITQLTGGVGLIYWGSANYESKGRAISISFTIAGDEVVVLSKPTVDIAAKDATAPFEFHVNAIRRAYVESSPSCDPPRDAVYQGPEEPMHRMPGTFKGRPVTNSVFVIDVTVPGNPEEFSVQLPPVRVDNKMIDVPLIHFVHKTSIRAVGIFSGSTWGN
jgi:hypothetical protein